MSNGNFAGGDGTINSPFLIEDAFDLDSMRNRLDKCYKLIKNIDLNINPFNQGEGWNPIGDTTSKFKGNFNGNGHVVKNLYINRPSKDEQGLFGYIIGGVKNIGVINVNITGHGRVGGLTGIADGSPVVNSYVTGMVKGSDYGIGGLIGTSFTSITNSYSIANVLGRFQDFTGVLVGSYSDPTKPIKSSYWNKETSNLINKAGVGKTLLEMKTPSTFIDWENEKLDNNKPVWILKEGQYPKLWSEVNNKFLIKQNEDYYSIKSNFYSIGQPTDNTQLENWYNKYGTDDINIITQILNNKEIPMSKNENDIWKTDFELDANDIKDSIQIINTDDSNKSIQYDCNDYKIFDLLDNEFDIMMAK